MSFLLFWLIGGPNSNAASLFDEEEWPSFIFGPGAQTAWVKKWDLDWNEFDLDFAVSRVSPQQLRNAAEEALDQSNLADIRLVLLHQSKSWQGLAAFYDERTIRMELPAKLDVVKVKRSDLMEILEYVSFWASDPNPDVISWESGCNSLLHSVPEQSFSGLPKGFIGHAWIIVTDDLPERQLDECLFRGFLAAMGLMLPQGFERLDEPLSPAERSSALAALNLLYHPSVKPGMTRQEVVETLVEEGLIDP